MKNHRNCYMSVLTYLLWQRIDYRDRFGFDKRETYVLFIDDFNFYRFGEGAPGWSSSGSFFSTFCSSSLWPTDS